MIKSEQLELDLIIRNYSLREYWKKLRSLIEENPYAVEIGIKMNEYDSSNFDRKRPEIINSYKIPELKRTLHKESIKAVFEEINYEDSLKDAIVESFELDLLNQNEIEQILYSLEDLVNVGKKEFRCVLLEYATEIMSAAENLKRYSSSCYANNTCRNISSEIELSYINKR